jgi:hypothetical protein
MSLHRDWDLGIFGSCVAIQKVGPDRPLEWMGSCILAPRPPVTPRPNAPRGGTSLLAPETGDLAGKLHDRTIPIFGVPNGEIEALMADATARFTDEWRERVVDPTDERSVVRFFYNESKTELFDLARWHAEDPIHFRTLVCADNRGAAVPAVPTWTTGRASVPTRWCSRRPDSTSRSPTSRARCSHSPNGAASGAAFRSARST